jgi:hypothetical protein
MATLPHALFSDHIYPCDTIPYRPLGIDHESPSENPSLLYDRRADRRSAKGDTDDTEVNHPDSQQICHQSGRIW